MLACGLIYIEMAVSGAVYLYFCSLLFSSFLLFFISLPPGYMIELYLAAHLRQGSAQGTGTAASEMGMWLVCVLLPGL